MPRKPKPANQRSGRYTSSSPAAVMKYLEKIGDGVAGMGARKLAQYGCDKGLLLPKVKAK